MIDTDWKPKNDDLNEDESNAGISPYEVGLIIILILIVVSVTTYILVVEPAIANIFSNITTGMSR